VIIVNVNLTKFRVCYWLCRAGGGCELNDSSHEYNLLSEYSIVTWIFACGVYIGINIKINFYSPSDLIWWYQKWRYSVPLALKTLKNGGLYVFPKSKYGAIKHSRAGLTQTVQSYW